MLELKNIKKSYKTGDFVQHALKGINIKFRKNEFVSILGPSGSGKTTLLNIIGGLDRYDSGDLIINNKSTKKFKDINWDFYRNNCVGFIFQSYNLISHISVIDNVIMSTTLSGYKRSKRKKLALDALTKVGLKEHAHKRPNQLSGGQMQRVAIARALVNNPDIILADEPTGALDSKTSKQIMDLIKEISKDKLVIMVTHNPELANTYSNRIIEFKDGEVVNDTNPYEEIDKNDKLTIKKTKMSYMSAISLSFNNLKTKFGRTFITSFASSIGIIGIALILALSNGFKIKIDEFEKDTLSQAPILISESTIDLTNVTNTHDEYTEYSSDKVIHPLKINVTSEHKNNIDSNYLNYIESIDKNLVGGIQYTMISKINMYTKVNDKVKEIDTNSIMSSIPSSMDNDISSIMRDNFDVIEGTFTNDPYALYILVDSKNRINEEILKTLGYDNTNISFEDIMDKEFKVVLNDTLYSKIGANYIPNTNLEELYNNESNITLKIKGIIRGKKDNDFATLSGTGILYNQSLISTIIDKNNESSIVKEQINSDFNILTKVPFDKENINTEKNMMLTMLGAYKVPAAISIYPKDFDSKDEILKYLDKYNKDKKDADKIIYMDQAKMITSLSGGIMDAITIVLIAFSSISLIVSSIMVGIITYTSVLERTKEIGILRAIGARKKDITRVFNAETLIIGLFSGILGIIIANILIVPINNIIYELSKLEGVANLNPIHAIILIIISMTLTLIGGFIPAKIASKKDPVIALRTE
ncbi:MAG: ATP-binding cassette domain-containing protein [Bacilli bacterium]|nr:ATP-binding cassette domain-containing protein [Bacilli bacterium]